jgi:hypothetical protein
MMQSTVSMRLPELYRLLTQNDCILDEEEIYRQIGRYSELLEFKNGTTLLTQARSSPSTAPRI